MHALMTKEYICVPFCTYICNKCLATVTGKLCVRLHFIKRTRKYLFCYFKMTVVIREQAKSTHDDEIPNSGESFK